MWMEEKIGRGRDTKPPAITDHFTGDRLVDWEKQSFRDDQISSTSFEYGYGDAGDLAD